jgi:Lon protease-like protein
MSVDPCEMPLLSMPAVLFPGTFLPVQISELPQRELVRECAEQNRSLGIVLNAGSGLGGPTVPHTTGCIASVALLLEDGEKDTLGAVLFGEQRMRVTTFRQQDPYVTGCVESFDDYSGTNAERKTKQASKLFQHYLELIRRRYNAQVVNVPLPDDPIMASYLLAAVLFLPLETKQRWLESASAALRLQEELAYLHLECDRLKTLLALSQQTQRQYITPDSHLFTSLVSQN